MKTSKELITELNELRKTKKEIYEFPTVRAWIEYGQKRAEQYGAIMQALEAAAIREQIR